MDSESFLNCPQCSDLIQSSAKRIIKDSCGHEKCRVCLLFDVEGCRQCLQNNSANNSDDISSSVKTAPEENKHTTVITYYNVHKLVPETQSEVSSLNKNGSCTENKKSLTNNNQKRSENTSTLKRRRGSSFKKVKSIGEKRTYNVLSIPNHITIEGKPPIFKCNICNSKFRTKSHVKYHEFCLGDKKPFACDTCSKTFILKSQLHVHQLIHSGKKPHVCRICDRAFRESGKLKRHMLLHSNDKPHICDECGKSFKTANSLKLHRLTHTGEKPFSCQYCKMKFSCSSNLKKHLVSHSDEKTHMCEQCGKKFKQKWALSVHRRSHLQIREYICSECSRGFVNQKDLKRHELIHLDTKMYTCSLCSISFRRKDNLKRHIRNAHSDEHVEIIKSIREPTEKSKNPVVDNPNAINVITAFPTLKKEEKNSNEIVTSPRTSMNGPLKLAFKTSAFKRNYNINRDYTFDANSRGESSIAKNNCSETETTQTYQKPTPRLFPNFSVDELYANRPQIIKNIKFKIPENYPPTNESILDTILPQTYLASNVNKTEQKNSNEDIQQDITTVNSSESSENISDSKIIPVIATSVIVNSSDQRNIHWRRRMSQNTMKDRI